MGFVDFLTHTTVILGRPKSYIHRRCRYIGGSFEDTVSKLEFESERVLEGIKGGMFEVVASNLDFESEKVLEGIKWGNF